MRIEIKITDISTLTADEVTDLNNYLTAARVSKQMANVDTEREYARLMEETEQVIRSHIDEANKCIAEHSTVQKPDESVFIPEELIDENGNIVDKIISKVTKPRKKRVSKAKPVKSTPDKKHHDELHIHTHAVEEHDNVSVVDFTAPRPPTYDNVLSFILENTRDKKLSFDTVQELLSEFKLSSLVDLNTRVELIQPFFTKLRGFVND